MTTYFIEPGDWESATGESLPSGSHGITVMTVADAQKALKELEEMWLRQVATLNQRIDQLEREKRGIGPNDQYA